jgi:zinc protease
MTTVRQSLPEVVQLMAELVRSSSLPEAEFQILKEQQLASLEEQRSDPSALAQIELARRTDPWPADHPRYIETVDESIERTRAVTLDQVRDFYRDFYGPQLGNLVIVGDFDPSEIRPVIEAAFGDWQSPRAFARIPTPFRDIPGSTIEIETPDKANAVFLARQNLELPDTEADYPALVLAGYMIGGGVLNSRLARRIRVQDGLSYGVGGGIGGHPVDRAGQFSASAIYAPENAAKLEAAFREEMAKVLTEGFTEEETGVAKQGWLESRQLGRAQDPSLAAQISSNLYFDRTFEFDAGLEARVRALTTQEINAAVRRHLDLSKLTIVKAGDFAAAKARIGVP